MNKSQLFRQRSMDFRQQGFTIMEFLVASTLGLIVILAVGAGYTATASLNQQGEERLSIQQDIRAATNMITRDAHMAGNFGCASMGSVAYGGKVNFHNGMRTKVNYPPTQLLRAGGQNTLSNPAPYANTTYSGDITHYGVTMIPTTNTEFAPAGFTKIGAALMFQYGTGAAAATLEKTFIERNAYRVGMYAGNIFNASGTVQSDLLDIISNKGFVALASCNRVDILRANEGTNGTGAALFTVNATTKKITNAGFHADYGVWMGVQPTGTGTGYDTEANAKLDYHSVSNIELMPYVVHIYSVGTFNGVTGLYRFALANNGALSTPQLLSSNVTTMSVQFGYPDPANCTSTSAANTETFTFSGNVAANKPPNLLMLTLNVSGKTNGVDGEPRTSTYESTATIRGGNVCANRSLES